MRVTTKAWTLLTCIVAACALGTGACASREQDLVMAPEVFGMTETTAPIYDDGQMQIFQVTHPIELPIRGPRDGERPGGDAAPYPQYPYLRSEDVRITVRFTLSNLEDKENLVELLVDPWNEFVRYVPGIVVTEEEALPNLSGIQRFYKLPPLGRVEGILTPDDMRELASDLATAMALAATPPPDDGAFGGPLLYNRAMNVQNRGTVLFDPVLTPYIPQIPPAVEQNKVVVDPSKKLIAGLTGFDVGLRTAAPARVAAELVIDLEDLSEAGDVVIAPDRAEDPIGPPGDTLSPPAAPAPM